MNATDLNVSVLANLVVYYGGAREFANAIPRECTGGNHIKRCQKAGLFVVEGKTIKLTETGIGRVTRNLESTIRQIEKGLIGKSEYAPFYTHANLAKHRAALETLTK